MLSNPRRRRSTHGGLLDAFAAPVMDAEGRYRSSILHTSSRVLESEVSDNSDEEFDPEKAFEGDGDDKVVVNQPRDEDRRRRGPEENPNTPRSIQETISDLADLHFHRVWKGSDQRKPAFRMKLPDLSGVVQLCPPYVQSDNEVRTPQEFVLQFRREVSPHLGSEISRIEMFARLMSQSTDTRYLCDKIHRYLASTQTPKLRVVGKMFLDDFWSWEQQKEMEPRFDRVEYDPKISMYEFASKWCNVLDALYTVEGIDPGSCVMRKLPTEFRKWAKKFIKINERLMMDRIGQLISKYNASGLNSQKPNLEREKEIPQLTEESIRKDMGQNPSITYPVKEKDGTL